MPDIIVWPHVLLVPEECRSNLVPFTRTAGRSLGGVKPAVRTDLGFWSIEYANMALYSSDQARTLEAIKDELSGSSGRIAVPVWAFNRAPYIDGIRVPPLPTLHDDDTTFDDDTEYEQGAISVVTSGITLMGATVISLRIIQADANLSGVLFSYNHALYRTGRVIDIVDDVWTMNISPTIRETIPDGADLEFDMPTCLCNLVDDRGADAGLNSIEFEQINVSFNEDTDYWNRLALGLDV